MSYKYFSVVALLFNSTINFFVLPAYGMDTWEIHTDNLRGIPKVRFYTQQDREIYKLHRGDSEIYSDTSCDPKGPIFANYFLNHSLSVIPTQFYAHIPLSSFLKLPEDIREEMKIDGVDPRSTKVLAVGQSAPLAGSFIGLYPHFATEPTAPYRGAYNVTRQLKLMITGSDSRRAKFERMPNESELLKIKNVENDGGIVNSTVEKKSIITHPLGKDNRTVLSPVPVRVVGIEDAGQSFYTYASYSEEGVKKAIVTLHLLWSRSQYRAFDEWSRKNFGLGDKKATRSTEELSRSFDDLIHSPAFRGGKHFQRVVELLQGVRLKEAVSSPEAFGATFNPAELTTAYDFSNAHYVGMPVKDIVKNIFTQRGYKDWDTLSEKEVEWVVARVKSQAERKNLTEFLKKQNYSDAFNKLKATTSASDEGVIKFLLSSNGYGKWETLLPETQKWVVTKVKEVAQLEEFLSKQDYLEAFNKLKVTTVASNEEVVKFLLSSNGYGKWEILLPETQKWVVTRIKSPAERKNLTEFLKKQDYAGAFNKLKATTKASDEELVKFLLSSNGYTSWAELDPDNKAWVTAIVTSKIHL